MRKSRSHYRYALIGQKINLGQIDYKKSDPFISKISTKSDIQEHVKEDNKFPPTMDYPYKSKIKRIKFDSKTQVSEKLAKKILRMDQAELDANFKGKKKKLPAVIYNILEDLNAHSKNSYLLKLGVWGKPVWHVAPATKERYVVPNQKLYNKGSKDFDNYRKHGGKTWEL